MDNEDMICASVGIEQGLFTQEYVEQYVSRLKAQKEGATDEAENGNR